MVPIEVEREPTNGAARPAPGAQALADLGALVDEHPVGVLATAVGIGYALGGGLFTRLTSRLVGWGLRLGVQFAVLPALEREVAGLAGQLGKTIKGGTPDEPVSRDSAHQ